MQITVDDLETVVETAYNAGYECAEQLLKGEIASLKRKITRLEEQLTDAIHQISDSGRDESGRWE